jgi:predicted permease
MSDILNLAMPFFGLILLGVFAARRWHGGEQGLAWLNIFLVYFALPALIFLVVSQAPFEELVNWPFVTATTSVTLAAFLTVMVLSRLLFGTEFRTAVLQGTSGSYGNVGYMGLPLAVAFFGPQAAVPAALVFCFDCALQFVLTAFLVTLANEREEEAHWGAVAWRIAKQVGTHPFIIATVLGIIGSAIHFKAPGALGTILEMLMKSAGPTALFALGVTVGMRRFAGVGPAGAGLHRGGHGAWDAAPVAACGGDDGRTADGVQRLHSGEPVQVLRGRRLDGGHRDDGAVGHHHSRSDLRDQFGCGSLKRAHDARQVG